ncbi:hypothetical protein LP419_23045 [Massilia sp. H-1]|nr:hypothetical protein LP419_23045 [Massilia sp. H-1]
MRIGIPAETRSGETRVAATPETVKKLAAKHQVIVQSGAGLNASVIDDAYVAAGATIGSAADAFGADVVLKVRAPNAEERADEARRSPDRHAQSFRCREHRRHGQRLACKRSRLKRCRASRAQSMDVLSSQANIMATRP